MTHGRHTQAGCGGHVFAGYWVAAMILIVGIALRVPIGRSTATMLATIVFLGGGLPHGAYDIALLRRTMALDRRALVSIVVGYVAVALAMAAAWLIAPLAALILFLTVAAVHFGADWQMLEEPLLRTAAGAAVIAAATIGHPSEVEALFVAMSDEAAIWVARCIMAAAPVVLLVTAVGIAIAWREGSLQWAAAMALCLVLLVVAPPVVGFALFFVFLHSPRHLASTRDLLGGMTRTRWVATGVALSAVAILGWYTLRMMASPHGTSDWTAQAFQLLASVAVPHLLLSHWIERRLEKPGLRIDAPSGMTRLS